MSKVTLWVAGQPKGPKLRADLLGDDTLDGGTGGWEDTEFGGKKNRRSGMVFKGSPGYTLTIPLGFNGIGGGGPSRASSVEAQCRRLAAWARPRKAGGRPPKLKVSGLLRAPGNITWVIDSITWGTQVRNSQGRRVQQQVEVTLIQYRPPRRIKSPGKK